MTKLLAASLFLICSNLANNSLRALPRWSSPLLSLDASLNRLQRFHADRFFHPEHLSSLLLNNNELDAVPQLGAFSNLSTVGMASNKLAGAVNLDYRNHSIWIHFLDVSGNDIRTLDVLSPGYISTLHAHDNPRLRALRFDNTIQYLNISNTAVPFSAVDYCHSLGSRSLSAQQMVHPSWETQISSVIHHCFVLNSVDLQLCGAIIPLSSLQQSLGRWHAYEQIDGKDSRLVVFGDDAYYPLKTLPRVSFSGVQAFECRQVLAQITVVGGVAAYEVELPSIRRVRGVKYECFCLPGYKENEDGVCTYQPPKAPFLQTKGGLVVVSLFALLGGVCLTVLVYHVQWKIRQQLRGLRQDNVRLANKVKALKQTWRISEHALEWGDKLGEGGYGAVYKARFLVADIGEVAVKRLKALEYSDEEGQHEWRRALEREAEFLIQVGGELCRIVLCASKNSQRLSFVTSRSDTPT